MAKTKITVYLILLAVVFILMGSPVNSQEDIATVNDAAFKTHIRPTVIFPHQKHIGMAIISDCNACHHVYQNGKQVEAEDSVGMECSECHYGKGKDRPEDLIRIYHLQCKGCHMAQKAGPILCGECHRKGKPSFAELFRPLLNKIN